MSTVRSQLEVAAPPAPRDRDPGKSPRDVQRDALRDLVVLATESAATEAEIERRLRSTTEQAGKEFEKTQFQLQQRHATERAAAEDRHQQRAAELHSQFMAEVTDARNSHAAVRERIERDHEPVDR